MEVRLEGSIRGKYLYEVYEKVYYFDIKCCTPLCYDETPIYASSLYNLLAKIKKNIEFYDFEYAELSHLKNSDYKIQMLDPIRRYDNFKQQIKLGYKCQRCTFISSDLNDVIYLHLEKKKLNYFDCRFCKQHYASRDLHNSHHCWTP